MNNQLNELQLDALREASNIGAGHAAIAMSQMLNKKIMIAVTRSDVVPSDVFLKNMAGNGDTMVASIYLQTLGDVQGALIFMFKKESVLKLGDMLLFKENGTTKFIDEKTQSALRELASILTGAFFTVLADMIGLKVFHKSPMYAFDKAETIMYGVCNEVFGNEDERLCITTEFIESSSQIKGSFAFLPTDDAMKKILTGLGNV